jgi:hypothetical protein
VYFERFYTKLIRYVSQGRLLRDSSRGVLLADKDRCLLGDDVTIRASLTDERFRPLTLPQVEATIVQPDGMRRPFSLARLAQARAGTYIGQFLATQEGDYRIELVLPSGGQDTVLEREVRVRIPDLEVERPQRNDALLSDLAHGTGGEYYVGMAAAVSGKGVPSLASRLQAKDLHTRLTGMPDRAFAQLLMAWLLALICGALCLEWLIRRLNRLA